jgi:hypothetical protein
MLRGLCPAILLLLSIGNADAAIHRCEAIDGVPVYTDRSCESLGIVDRGRPPMVRRRVGSAAAAGSLGSSCAARTPESLRHAVIDAIDRRDFNALSGLYNFDGRSRQTAAGVVRRLERMARRSALEVELIVAEVRLVAEFESLFDVRVAAPSAAVPTELPTLRVVQPSGGRDGLLSIESFRIARSAGCVWLAG